MMGAKLFTDVEREREKKNGSTIKENPGPEKRRQ
jgi:hypothetical protein